MTLYKHEQKKSYQHAYTVQDIFITDCYFKTLPVNIAIQQRPIRRKILNG